MIYIIIIIFSLFEFNDYAKILSLYEYTKIVYIKLINFDTVIFLNSLVIQYM